MFVYACVSMYVCCTPPIIADNHLDDQWISCHNVRHLVYLGAKNNTNTKEFLKQLQQSSRQQSLNHKLIITVKQTYNFHSEFRTIVHVKI
jgi:hypothetical protein